MRKFVDNLFNNYFNTNQGYMHIANLLKQEFPSINMDFSNLENLEFIEMSEKEYKESQSHGIYFAKGNKILIYKDKTLNDENLVETLIHEMIHAITSKVIENLIIEGFNFRDNGESSVFLYLNEGLTQYIANRIMKKRSDAYLLESKFIEQLLSLGNANELIQGFFNMDYMSLINYLQKTDNDLDVHNFVNKIYYAFKYFYSYIFCNFYEAGFYQNEFYKISSNNLHDVFYILQEEFLNLYKKSINQPNNFKDLMLNESEVDMLLNPPGISEEQRLDINLCGFRDIDKLRNFDRKVS